MFIGQFQRKFFIYLSLFVLINILIIFFSVKAQPVKVKECCILKSNKVDLGNGLVCYKVRPLPGMEKYTVMAPNRTQANVCASPINERTTCENEQNNCWCSNSSGSAWATFCLIDSIQYATNWIFYILSVVVALLAIYGAFVITTAAGDPNKVTSGRKILTFALIGLAIALFSKFLPAIVRFFIMR